MRRRHLRFLLLAVAGAWSAALCAQSVPHALVPGGPAVSLEVAPGTEPAFTMTIPASKTVVVTLTEERQTSTVTWTDGLGEAHTPRSNMAGKSATIRFTVIGSGTGLQRFSVAPNNRKRGSTLRVAVSAAHDTEAQDAVAVDAEEALAEGESLWQKHDRQHAGAAMAAFDQAIAGAEELHDIPMLRSSLTWKGVYLTFVDDQADAGLALLLRATALPDAGDLVEEASSWKSLGFVHTELADYTEGWADYGKALELFRRSGDVFNQEVLLENRGDLLQMTGDYEDALEDVSTASRLAQELGDQTGVLHIEEEIGGIYLQRGEMQAAFEAYERAMGLTEMQPHDVMIGFVETDLARLYHRLGAGAQAQDMLARANAFWAANPYLLGQLTTLVEQGRIESDTGELTQAAATYEKGLALARDASMKRETVFCLLGLGRSEGERGAARLMEASELATTIHEDDALAQIHTAQGDLALRGGDTAGARQDYQQALEVASRSFDHTEAVRALGGLAHAEFEQGENATARQHIEQALDGIESTRQSIPPGSLQTGYFSSWHSYYTLAIRVLMRMAVQNPGAGYAREALTTAERGRARLLLDELEAGGGAETHVDARPGTSRAETLRQLHLAEYSLAALRGKSAASARAQQLQSEVAELREREDRIEAALHQGRAHAQLVSDGAAGNPVSRLQEQLGAHTSLLEYWTDREASYLWVVSEGSVRSFMLPGSAQLGALTSRLTRELVGPFVARTPSAEAFATSLAQVSTEYDATALELTRLVLPGHAIPASTRTLLVVGDGPLQSIPFEALRLTAHGHSAYLQDRYCVVREPSIGVLLALLQYPEKVQPMRVALVADPVFSASDPRLTSHATQVARAALTKTMPSSADWTRILGANQPARLRYAGEEARDLASLAGPQRSTLALGFGASVEHVRTLDWSDFTVAHFATHAFLNTEHPELASVALSMFDAEGHPQPGLLWFSDIASLHMPVELVVLSACQTANGQLLPGEGLVGLSYSFLLAGAHRVVGSLWDVDDEATEALMHRFYAALLSGTTSPAEALRRAQREMAAMPRWHDPYYWAGFTIEGDARIPATAGEMQAKDAKPGR